MTTNLMPAEGIHWAPLPLWAAEALYDNGTGVATQAAYLAFWVARDRKTGVARLSRTELMKRLQVSDETARRATRELERLGLIRRENTASGGRGAWPRYFVALDAPHLFPYRANPSAEVTTVRGPRADVPKVPKRANGARPLVPSALPDTAEENPLTNPLTTPLNPLTTDGVYVETPSPQMGYRPETPSPQRDTRHLEVKQKQQQMRARSETGGGTPVLDAAAAVTGDTQKPRHEVPAGLDALAELREAIGTRGVLPVTPEADERVRVWFAAGWTAVTLAQHLSERVNRPGMNNPAGLVLTILRGAPAAAPAAPTPERPGDASPCAVCGRGEWACGRAAVLSGDPHQYQAKSANEKAGGESVPTAGLWWPSEGLAVAELGALGSQAHELLEQALSGLPADIQAFARTGRQAG